MTEYRPRPDDHLVEPLFGGLHGAHSPSADGERARRRLGHAPLALVLLSIAVATVVWLV